MDLNRPMEAADAFEAALASPTRRVREDAAYGQSLAYLRAGLSNNAAVAATKAPQSRQRAAELQVAILVRPRPCRLWTAKRYRETLIYLDQRAQLQQERIDLMVLQWLLLHEPTDVRRRRANFQCSGHGRQQRRISWSCRPQGRDPPRRKAIACAKLRSVYGRGAAMDTSTDDATLRHPAC
jgi:hypothetical protein